MAQTPSARAAAELPVGDIQLYDNYLPTLDAGEYQITVDQALPTLNTGNYFRPITQDFEVRAPQFSLDPRDVGEVFPPADSNGVYGSVLPTIVLNQRVLPWERLVTKDANPDDKKIPWMALLTLEVGDILPEPTTKALIRTSTVAELLAPDPDVLKPDIDPQYVPADVLASTCQSVVVPAAVFRAVTPRLDELSHLAHVRQTDTGSQAASGGAEDGWYAVVISNRFPDSDPSPGGAGGSKNVVCLVSLEGFAGVIKTSAALPGRPDGTFLDVQLAVLTTWSFVSNPAAKEGFAQLMEHFVTDEGSDPQNLLPRIPVAGAPSSPAAERLRQGYAPLVYHTPVGEETFAWFRGPFTPVVPQPLPPPPDGAHYTSSSELAIYLQSQGVFDLSYAAAFEVGRALALSDRAFATALINSRRQAFAKLKTIDQHLASGRFDDVPVADLLKPNLTRKKFGSLLNGGMVGALTDRLRKLGETKVTPTSPRAAAPRPGPVARLRELLAREDVGAVLDQHVDEEMDPVTEWLAHLALLYNVPFSHLAPDQRMLPVESIRFFYIDEGWVGATLDGALSIGVEGSRDLALHDILRERVLGNVRVKIGRVRARRRRKPSLAVETPAGGALVRSGFLIRSAVVAGWPGLVVKADDGATPVLRMDLLSQNVLLIIFLGIPKTVTFSEPWHGLRFGVEDGDVIQLRSLVGKPLNQTFPTAGGFSQFFRAPDGDIGRRVISLEALLPALAAALANILGGQPLGPALFATEMVLSPERLAFVPGSDTREA